MTFRKYPSIDSTEKKKTFQRFLDQYPELYGAKCHIQEKIDGSNIQIAWDVKNGLRLGKRSGFLSENENFQGIWNVWESSKEQIFNLGSVLMRHFKGESFRLYGELFGQGIQNRIDYGSGQKIIIFDAFIDETPVPYEDLKHFGGNLVVESFGICFFEEADNVSVENLLSHYSPSGQYAEGVVIKPSIPFEDKGDGSLIALKKKSSQFSEKSNNKHKKSDKGSNFSKHGQYLKEQFESFLNENRVLSVFSKEGQIESENQISDYIKLILEDAKEDFFRDFSEDFRALEQKEQRAIFKSAGSVIVPILKKHL